MADIKYGVTCTWVDGELAECFVCRGTWRPRMYRGVWLCADDLESVYDAEERGQGWPFTTPEPEQPAGPAAEERRAAWLTVEAAVASIPTSPEQTEADRSKRVLR